MRYYSQAQVNWLLMRAYKSGWDDGHGAISDWFIPTAEDGWLYSKVRKWCCDKAGRPKAVSNRPPQQECMCGAGGCGNR